MNTPFLPHGPNACSQTQGEESSYLMADSKVFSGTTPSMEISTIQKGESDIVFIVSKGVPCAYLELCVNI